MPASFPGALPPSVTGTATPSTTLANAGHATALHQKDRDEIIALGTKVGLGSASGTPGTGVVLVGTGAGTSAWQPITATFIASGAVGSAALATGSVTSGAIATNAVTSGAIATNAVTTAKLLANAVTQVWTVAATASASTTSTTAVDMPQMTTGTITTNGGDLYVFANTCFYTASGGSFFTALKLDTGANSFVYSHNPVQNNVTLTTTVGWFTGVAAGTHEIKALYWITSIAGTGYLYSTDRRMVVMEIKR